MSEPGQLAASSSRRWSWASTSRSPGVGGDQQGPQIELASLLRTAPSSANRSVMSTSNQAIGARRCRPGCVVSHQAATVPGHVSRRPRRHHPDKPAVVMAGSGQVVTYRELDAEANRVSHLFRSLGLRPGDHVAFCLENHPFHARLGRVLRRPLLHGDEPATDDRRDGLHHRRLRRAGLRDLRLQGGPGRRARGCAGRWRGDVHAGWRHRRLRAVRGGHRRATGHTAGRGANRGSGHALLVGHDRAPQGHRGPAVGRTHRQRRPGPPAAGGPLRRHRRHRHASPPPRCTTRRRCASPWRSTGWAARRW